MKRIIPIVVFLAIAAACFIHLGTPSLYETDEGFAANRADSFYRHHTWRLSFDDVGETAPQFRKPPLLYWCVAALYQVMGRTMWAVRMPTAIAGFLCALLTWRLARRFFDNTTGLLAALLLVTIPFVLLHIRTAMLEMPLVCLLLAGAYGFTFLTRPSSRAAALGLSAGAAILLKGGAGAYVLVVPLVFGLIYRRFRPAALLEGLIAILVALLLPLTYFAAVPAEYRMTMLRHLFVEEASERIRVFHNIALRLPGALKVLTNTLGWHVPAAVLGLCGYAAGIRRHNAWERSAFITLVIMAALPLLWVYASMVHPFPRYLLPMYPLLLILSAGFARNTAALFPVKLQPWLFWALIAAIALPSSFAASGLLYHPGPDRGPRPELVPLAQRLQDLVPEGSNVVVEERLKCHTLLFHGRRPIDSVEDWLLTAAQPGDSRYGIFQHAPPRDIPGVIVETLAESGSWKLMKLTVSPTNAPWAGILFTKTTQRDAVAAMLNTMAIECTPFAKGFVLRHIPDAAPVHLRYFNQDTRIQTPGTPLLLKQGEPLSASLSQSTPCAGFDLIPATKRESMEGWRIEYRNLDQESWTLLRTVDAPQATTYAVVNGRLEQTTQRALRLRFAPVTAIQWRFTRTGTTPVTLIDVKAFTAIP
jgi:4-amino-4-deoxy-L-arabinose transferase-like glycosyltransferase